MSGIYNIGHCVMPWWISNCEQGSGTTVPVFLQDQNFWGSLMTPCLKIWGSLANLEGQNFFYV